jgi:IS605 OrfB family transposase
MDITKTAKQKLLNFTRYQQYTLDVYRTALEAVSRIVEAEWPCIEAIEGDITRKGFVDNLIHSTSGNVATYPEFDEAFYKFPSYLRRAVIADAIGNVSSHMTRLSQWEFNPKGKPPTFNPSCNSFPVFYKDNMSEWIRNGKVKLKLFTGTDWIWFTLPFVKIKAHRFPFKEGWVRQNPMLVDDGHKWKLHFPFLKKVKLKDKDFIRPVLSVDLGLNCTATVSVIKSDGTVLHREFINYGRGKDRLYTVIGTIAVKSSQTYLIPEGSHFCKALWCKVSNITEEIAHQCSHRLVEIAANFNCQAIVFEHLGKLKVPKSFYGAARLRRKFHYWLQGRIRKYTKYKGYSEGIRFSRVLARGTSAEAFDGSGKVWRLGNRQIALFRNEKEYNCDLSASYNIGARYWIREYQEHPKSQLRDGLVAAGGKSVPPVVARHQQCLASLISLVRSASPGSVSALVPYPGEVLSSKLEETATRAYS